MRSSPGNVLYLLSALSTLGISMTVGIQPLFLDDMLAIPFEKAGTINAHLTVMTEIVSLALVGWAGLALHRLGQVRVLYIGFLLAALGGALAPFSSGAQWVVGLGGLGFYSLTRILISLGTDTVQMGIASTTSAWTVARSHHALLVNATVMMGLGATVMFSIIMQIPHDTGTVYIVMFLPALFGLMGAWIVRHHLHLPGTSPSLTEGVAERAWELVSGDPRLQLGLAAAFYTRADMIVISLFLTLWCVSLADAVGVSRTFATAHAGGLMGVMGLALLASIPVWKQFLSRASRVAVIGASLSLSGLGFLLLMLVKNPFDWTIVPPLLLVGLGLGGALIAPRVLALDLAPGELLGPLLGVFHLVGGVGVVLLVQSGGYYFDAVGPRSPFVLMGTGNLLVMLYAVWLVRGGLDETSAHVLKKHRKLDLKPLIFLLSALPLVWLVGRVVMSGYVPGSSVGQMPVGFINRYLGDWALNFLVISLALRPLYETTGIRMLAQYRRMVGLYAAFYAMLHVCTYVGLEWMFNWGEIIHDMFHKRPFIILGVVAFVMLVVLTVTSTNQSIRRMGGKRWKKLHQLNYVINLLVALHFIFAATHDNGEPWVYLGLILVLLGYRWRQWRGT
ncbi:MAG: sulfoxide reductase heme-binding subunit YedZ [Magnetococcus sp. WYHC-3]